MVPSAGPQLGSVVEGYMSIIISSSAFLSDEFNPFTVVLNVARSEHNSVLNVWRVWDNIIIVLNITTDFI